MEHRGGPLSRSASEKEEMKHSSDRQDKRSRKENNHKKGRPSRDQGGGFGGSSNNAHAVIALNAVPSQAVCARCLRKMSPQKKGQVDLQTHGANRCVEWPHVPQSLRTVLDPSIRICPRRVTKTRTSCYPDGMPLRVRLRKWGHSNVLPTPYM